jgi:hypothetical protein
MIKWNLREQELECVVIFAVGVSFTDEWLYCCGITLTRYGENAVIVQVGVVLSSVLSVCIF